MTWWQQLPDGIVRDSLEHMSEDEREFLAEKYIKSDEDSKLDIEAFFHSNGPSMVQQSKMGIPTSEELNQWLLN